MKKNLLFTMAVIFAALSANGSASAQEKYVKTSDGIKLFVKTSGKGLPCLFIHGGPGQGSRSFEQMGGSSLEKYLTMIYLDQRGSGKSESSANYSMDRMIRDIEEVRQALGYQKMVLLAHSFGGILAVGYARKYPKRVSRLIMSNATLNFLSRELIMEQIEFAASLAKKDFPVDDKMSRDELLKIWSEARQELNRQEIGYKILTENVETIQKMNSIDRDPERNRDFGSAVINDSQKFAEYYADYTSWTSQMKIPALVITGTTDHAVGINHYRFFNFRRQTVKEIPGGHLPYYDQNETFVEAINSFVNGKKANANRTTFYPFANDVSKF